MLILNPNVSIATPRSERDVKIISIVTPVFNEEETVRRCHEEVARVMKALAPKYDYEHLFADNCSTDRTLSILREIASTDPRVKVVAWSRNFGAERSGFAAMNFTIGDAVIGIPADLQEPPDQIPKFIAKWEEGYDVVYGTYSNPYEGFLKRALRKLYYRVVDRISSDPLPHDFSGFALSDRVVVDEVLKLGDVEPYIRGMVATVGFRQVGMPYERQPRRAGRSKHGLAFLLSFATNGIITHSMWPIRMATLSGTILALVAILLAFVYALIKIFNWNIQAPGATSIIVLVLFFFGIQLLFFGILGEYIGAIHAQVRRNRPFVILKERINVTLPHDAEHDRSRTARASSADAARTSPLEEHPQA